MKFLRASAAVVVVTCALLACSRSKTDSSSNATQAQSLTVDAAAAPADSSGQPFGDHAPSPAMFDACNSKADGDPCQVTIRDRDMTGLCGATRPGSTDTRLFCHTRPTFFGNRPRHGNPVLGNPQMPTIPGQPPAQQATPVAPPAAQ